MGLQLRRKSKNTIASGRLFGYDANVKDGQKRIAIVAEPLDGKDGIEIVTRKVTDRCRTWNATPSLVGRQATNTLVDPILVVRVTKVVHAALDEYEIERPAVAGDALPEFKRSEESFAFTVELRPLDRAMIDADTQRKQQLGKGFAELLTSSCKVLQGP